MPNGVHHITIDGPAGAGKSSAARALAQRLGFEFLDTGAMYRAVAWAGLEAGIDLHDQDALAGLLPAICLEMPAGRVVLNGVDITTLLRTQEITAASGPVASNSRVRSHLVRLQQALAEGRNMVSEGRDQGTVVFPDALCKFFVIADPVERARRRQADMAKRGEHLSLDEILEAQEIRDRRDASRDVGPMIPAPDAIRLDSTGLTLEQVVDRMEKEVRLRLERHQISGLEPV
jgi:cytidylate kinase